MKGLMGYHDLEEEDCTKVGEIVVGEGCGMVLGEVANAMVVSGLGKGGAMVVGEGGLRWWWESGVCR